MASGTSSLSLSAALTAGEKISSSICTCTLRAVQIFATNAFLLATERVPSYSANNWFTASWSALSSAMASFGGGRGELALALVRGLALSAGCMGVLVASLGAVMGGPWFGVRGCSMHEQRDQDDDGDGDAEENQQQ